MDKPYDHYVEQQKRKAEQLEATIRADERERIIKLLEVEGVFKEMNDNFAASIRALINGEN